MSLLASRLSRFNLLCRLSSQSTASFATSLQPHSNQHGLSASNLSQSCLPAATLSYPFQQRNFSSKTNAESKNEVEKLYRAIDILVKGHENSVLKSYAEFCELAAQELEINCDKVIQPKAIYDRLTFLKSAHIHGRHRVQYEMRTYKRVIQLKFLTESTANVYLEYIQRNLPAGVAMHVHKWEIQRIPSHIRKEMAGNMSKLTDKEWDREKKQMEKMHISKAMTEKDFEEYITTKPHLVGTTT